MRASKKGQSAWISCELDDPLDKCLSVLLRQKLSGLRLILPPPRAAQPDDRQLLFLDLVFSVER